MLSIHRYNYYRLSDTTPAVTGSLYDPTLLTDVQNSKILFSSFFCVSRSLVVIIIHCSLNHNPN